MDLDRRKFFKSGGLMAMNAIKTPGFLKDKPNPEVNGSEDITKAMEHFGVTQKDLHKVLSAALDRKSVV